MPIVAEFYPSLFCTTTPPKAIIPRKLLTTPTESSSVLRPVITRTQAYSSQESHHLPIWAHAEPQAFRGTGQLNSFFIETAAS